MKWIWWFRGKALTLPNKKNTYCEIYLFHEMGIKGKEPLNLSE